MTRRRSWGPRHIVRSFDGLVVGSIGFFGAPAPARRGAEEAEVGFGLVEDARGHGAVTEALRALLEETDRAGVRVRASVRPENRASLRVLAKCGFTQLRGDRGRRAGDGAPAFSVTGSVATARPAGPVR